MYNNNRRPQGGRSNFGRGSLRGGRGNNRGRRSGGRRRFDNAQHIDHLKYKKPIDPTKVQARVEAVKNNFEDYNLHETVLRGVIDRGFATSTEIQHEVIPQALNKKNVLGLASTGAGKTGAFLIPLINFIWQGKEGGHKHKGLILAPTRELAEQIEQELRAISRKLPKPIYSTLCIGGMPIGKQIRTLKMHNDLIIGTPGRVMDLLERGFLKIGDIDTVVLDEVDRMLDMGFVDDITRILDSIEQDYQSLYFSATLDKKTKQVVERFMPEYHMVELASNNASDYVEQDAVVLSSRNDKMPKLKELLTKFENQKVLIFCEMKSDVDRVAEELYKNGFAVEAMHSGFSQGRRNRALSKFKEGRAKIMVATDVAARGIDVKDIACVINYDEPNNFETYIHRIGRAGRSGSVGAAYTFVVK